MFSDQHIEVCFNHNGPGIFMPVDSEGKVKQSTLVSQFPTATGLKYQINSKWMAVPTDGSGGFIIPHSIDKLFVTSSNAKEVRQILSTNNLATEVSKVFGQSPLSNPKFLTSRKDIRNSYKVHVAKKKGFQKTCKVIFVSDVPLPSLWTRNSIIVEGIFTLNSYDSESTIKENLATLLQQSTGGSYTADRIVFLSYSGKVLNLPCVPPGFQWNGECLKANIGQGKLYVMVKEDKKQLTMNDESGHLSSDGELPDPLQTRNVSASSDVIEKTLHESPKDGRHSESSTSAVSTPFVDANVSSDLAPLVPVRRKRTLRRAALRCNNTIATVTQRSASVSTASGGVCGIQDTETGSPCIEIIDSEDEELQRVLESSLQDSIYEGKSVAGRHLSDIMKDFLKKINKFDKQEIIVKRSDVLGSVFRALKRPSFDLMCKLYVKFSGELGMDHGGPRRELFRLAIKELGSSSMFEGSCGNRVLSHDIMKLNQGYYKLAGILVGLSIANEGPCVTLCKEFFSMMTGVAVDLLALKPCLVQDEEYKQNLISLQNVKDYQERDIFLSSKGEWLLEQGYTEAWKLKPKDIPEVVGILVKNFIFYRVSAEVEQFCSGMNKVGGLWDLIVKDPLPWEDVFCTHRAVSKKFFIDEIEVQHSPEGSNRRKREEETVYAWEIFLQDIEEKLVDLNFEDLLSFITGAGEIPVNGFDSKLSMQFYDNDDEKRLPFSSTCSLTFSLPRGCSCELLPAMVVRAIKESQGFHKI
ncbi:uncharacterized protein LOC134283390 isoform X2 [Saccostrea cucullata]|uniref:uncharacterized protein LOC134283390 isoform X2 n=1 Tax=Saccostrea cuccullata TaxID=36930 RepID=UPI002ED5635E